MYFVNLNKGNLPGFSHIIKNLWFISIIIALTACGHKDNNISVGNTGENDSGIAIPAEIIALATLTGPNTAANLKAYLSVTTTSNATPVVTRKPMTLSNDLQSVSTSIAGLSATTYTFDIIFEYTTTFTSQPIVLASSTQEITPLIGTNTLPPFQSYTFSDDNRDGVNNIDEIAAGTDPGRCVLSPDPTDISLGSRVGECRISS